MRANEALRSVRSEIRKCTLTIAYDGQPGLNGAVPAALETSRKGGACPGERRRKVTIPHQPFAALKHGLGDDTLGLTRLVTIPHQPFAALKPCHFW